MRFRITAIHPEDAYADCSWLIGAIGETIGESTLHPSHAHSGWFGGTCTIHGDFAYFLAIQFEEIEP